jgi:hypothetical protein
MKSLTQPTKKKVLQCTIDPARICLKSVRLEPVERRGVFDKLSPNGVNTSPCRINSAELYPARLKIWPGNVVVSERFKAGIPGG